jgi:hypothetical protein
MGMGVANELASMGSNVNGLGWFGIGVAGASVPVMAGMYLADGGVVGSDGPAGCGWRRRG